MRPPSFNQSNLQNNQGNQSRYQGNNFNKSQNRGGNFNQNRQNNQEAVYQTPPYQPSCQPLANQALPSTSQIQSVSKTDFESYAKANDANMNNLQMKLDNFQRNQNDFQRSYNDSQKKQDDFQNMMLGFMQNYHNNSITSTSRSGTLPSQTTPLVPTTPVVSTPQKEPEQNPETSIDKVQKPSSENTAQVPPPGEEDSIFIEILKPRAKKTVNVEIQEPNSPRPNSYQPKLPYPERMKVRENDKPSAQHSWFLKMFKQLHLEIGLKDALVEMPKFNKWLSSLLRNKEKLEEIAIITVNAECFAIIMNKVPEKLKDPRKFLIPCALQELDRTSALADSGASINLLPHSIYKQLGLEALTLTRMTLELANRSVIHPMGIVEDVVVRVDGFTFLADFIVVNFQPDPRVPIILGRPFLRTAKALIDLYEEKLTLRVGKEELNDKDVKIKSSPSFTLTSPEESELIWEEFDRDLIPPGIDLTLPPTIEVSSSHPTSPTLTGEKDLKKDLAVALDSTESSILPPPLLDSDSPFTAELSASITLNSLRNEDKVFKPEPSSPRPPPEPPDVCLSFKPNLAMKNVFVKLNEDFYQSEKVLSLNVEDVDSFTFIIWTFLPFLTYPEESPLFLSFRSTDKTKITRNPSKMDKHRHWNQKSTKEANDSKPKPRKVNYGQALVKSGQTVKESQTLVNRSQPLEDKNPNVSI
ncbi:reverse transcriptase domain-containing protein [Tanacetum coccineum]